METLLIPLLFLCALLLVPCVIAASDLHIDLRITRGGSSGYDGPTPLTIQGTTLDDVKQIVKGKVKGVRLSNVWHNSKLVDALAIG